MDPLSITASVITLLQATTAIISICYSFRAALKNAPWSLTRIIDELKCLRNILESLEELSHGLDQSSGSGKRPVFEWLSDPDNGPFIICLRELSSLDKKIKFSSYAGTTGLKRKSALQALGWQLKDGDAKECLERIERCKTTLSLALTVDEATLLINIQELTLSLSNTTRNTDYSITIMADNFLSKHLDEEHRAIMQWLSPVDPHENHKSAISAHEEGSGDWILESKEFMEWQQARNSFLWLSGFAGAGKTILLSHIVEYLGRRQTKSCDGSVIAYFYFDFSRREFQDARTMAGSLVAQLCSQFQYPQELALAFNESQRPGHKQPPSWELLKRTILYFAGDRKVTLLVDALDECEDREQALAFLSRLQGDKFQISVIVTSRDEADIERAFHLFPRLRLENRRSDVDKDIKSYIDRRLEVDPGLKNLSLSVKSDIRLSLSEKCAGMFRWAQCQLDALSQLRTLKAIRENLNKLPEGLNETYANILKKTRKDDVGLLRIALRWVALAAFPLTIEELRDAVAIEPGIRSLDQLEELRVNNADDILRVGGSLLSVSEKGHVRLAHLSVKNYLLSAEIRTNPEVSYFAMSPEQENMQLALYCLTYLSLDTIAAGPCVEVDEWAARLASQPLLKHAAKAWPYYLRAAGSIPIVMNRIVSEFFAPNSRDMFMSWVQVLNSNWIFDFNDYPKRATPLYYAASFGLYNIVNSLVESKVDLDARGSRFGGTALHGATLREHTDVMKTLLDAGADPSRADSNRVTPLHTATTIGNIEVIKLLLEFGASTTAADSLGETPYDWALKSGQIVSQKLLRGEDCQPSADSLKPKQDTVYQRPTAVFPAMAVSQGLVIPSPMEKL